MNKKEHLAKRIGVKCTSRFAARVWVARHPYDPKFLKLPKWMMQQIRRNINTRVKYAEMAYRTALTDYHLHPPQTEDDELKQSLRLLHLHSNIVSCGSITVKDLMEE
ncbi:MAG: hypothetical protein SPM02_02985 [Bacteroidales bacterium]|nr:hypothetical protein [Bacteroidales bacterium]